MSYEFCKIYVRADSVDAVRRVLPDESSLDVLRNDDRLPLARSGDDFVRRPADPATVVRLVTQVLETLWRHAGGIARLRRPPRSPGTA
ncbi:hypothetical protein [Amycolatopsis eburnea]|uniref:Uncharacterized protein n=1 Tax=Amycolatopsis eburnea TaxID=2267691 RepID=A0A3R9F5J9_9PSEU|nr:hypothetical protein [Amycolatopsis eburnea]RSD16413.1 hypothetical protein EIY87_22475 [Amycolatopsis eburnea]